MALSLEAGGQAREFHIRVDDPDGKLGDFLQLGGGRFFPTRVGVKRLKK